MQVQRERSRSRLAATAPFLGPALVTAIAYVDPGNFATNVSAGAEYGYLLVWVVLVSNVMAMLIQYLSAKLGIATRRSLAAVCRDRFPRRVVVPLWLQAELVAIATDLAEVVGGAVALQILFGTPLLVGGTITAVGAFALLTLHTRGARTFQAAIAVFLGVILLGFACNVFLSDVEPKGLIEGVVPRFDGTSSVLLATGMLGATVMPHAIYLHGALTGATMAGRTADQQGAALRAQRIDVVVAMTCAGVMNLALLVIAAAALASQTEDLATLQAAHGALGEVLGPAAALAFALSLLASGFAASSVGTLAGQVVMEGFLRRRLPLALRRLVTLAPALVVLGLGVDPTRALVISQVVLSFGIPFALVPLVMITASKQLMGTLVNRRITTLLASLVAAVIVVLNLVLVVETARGNG